MRLQFLPFIPYVVSHGLCRRLLQPLAVVWLGVLFLAFFVVTVAKAEGIVLSYGAWLHCGQRLPFTVLDRGTAWGPI